jgi:glycosidase
MPDNPNINLSSPKRIRYLEEADYSRPLPDIPVDRQERLLERLRFLYGDEIARATLPELLRLLKVHHAHKPEELLEAERTFDPAERFTQSDVMLITYGDTIRDQRLTGLAALGSFLEDIQRRARLFSILHVLPFFPYTSDRGFSITDFRLVDSHIGTWQDIERLGDSVRLMFDGVVNHASSKSTAFQQMLSGNPDFKDFAVCLRSAEEFTPEHRRLLRRPRTSDVLTQYLSIDGPVWVWTTFSPDQIDLNYKNPKVLLNVVDTLLFYVRKGADLVRLDAVTYLWDELGTSGASLAQTHQIVKLFRDVLDLVAPQVAIVTETNVPHDENVSYFGDGSDEAQIVYNFALPPLVLHAFYRADTTLLSGWANRLEYPSKTATYLNILDTHDGVGLPGAANILPQEEIDFLAEKARQQGAFISYRSTAAGDVPYEINTTWYSALNLENCGETRELQVQRFVASRSIALALRGVPAFYIHSLVGTRSDIRLALQTKVKRDVNRAVLDAAILKRNLAEPGSKVQLIMENLGRMMTTRVLHRAFHPNGEQRILMLSPQVFAVQRISPAGGEHILCLTNVANRACHVDVATSELGVDWVYWYDLVAGRGWTADRGKLRLRLQPFDVLWLTPFTELERTIESAF